MNMTLGDAEHAYWMDYLRMLADRLGLRDWRIELWRDATASGVLATVCVTNGARSAVINLGERWGGLEPDRQRQVLVHELLHCHLEELQERAQEVADRFSENTLVSHLPTLIRHEVEHAIDAIAEAIAALYPLPGALHGHAYRENGHAGQVEEAVQLHEGGRGGRHQEEGALQGGGEGVHQGPEARQPADAGQEEEIAGAAPGFFRANGGVAEEQRIDHQVAAAVAAHARRRQA